MAECQATPAIQRGTSSIGSVSVMCMCQGRAAISSSSASIVLSRRRCPGGASRFKDHIVGKADSGVKACLGAPAALVDEIKAADAERHVLQQARNKRQFEKDAADQQLRAEHMVRLSASLSQGSNTHGAVSKRLKQSTLEVRWRRVVELHPTGRCIKSIKVGLGTP